MKTDPIGQFTETQSYTIRTTYTEVFSDKKKVIYCRENSLFEVYLRSKDTYLYLYIHIYI